MLNILRLEINAGLNLEKAFTAIQENLVDVWAGTIRRLVFLVHYGMPLKEAMSKIDQELDLEDFHKVVSAVQQASSLGTSLGDILALQSEFLATRRRQKAEEKARLASVKISLPLVFLIFPALLIVYLAPAILQISQL
jgi:tight adherence protein C